MKCPIKYLVALLLFVQSAFGQATNTVTFTFQDVLSIGYSNRNVTFTPLSTPLSNAPAIVVSAPAMKMTDTNGVLVLTNVHPGTYRASVQGSPTVTSFNFTVPTNQGALIGWQLLTGTNISPDSISSYTRSQANSTFVSRAGTNTTLRTNGGLVYIDATGGSTGSATNVDVRASTGLSASTNAGVITIGLTNASLTQGGTGKTNSVEALGNLGAAAIDGIEYPFYDTFKRANTGTGASALGVSDSGHRWFHRTAGLAYSFNAYVTNGVLTWSWGDGMNYWTNGSISTNGTATNFYSYPTVDLGFNATRFGYKFNSRPSGSLSNYGSDGFALLLAPSTNDLESAFHIGMDFSVLRIQIWTNGGLTTLASFANPHPSYGTNLFFDAHIVGNTMMIDTGYGVFSVTDSLIGRVRGRYFTVENVCSSTSGNPNKYSVLKVFAGQSPYQTLLANSNGIATNLTVRGGILTGVFTGSFTNDGSINITNGSFKTNGVALVLGGSGSFDTNNLSINSTGTNAPLRISGVNGLLQALTAGADGVSDGERGTDAGTNYLFLANGGSSAFKITGDAEAGANGGGMLIQLGDGGTGGSSGDAANGNGGTAGDFLILGSQGGGSGGGGAAQGRGSQIVLRPSINGSVYIGDDPATVYINTNGGTTYLRGTVVVNAAFTGTSTNLVLTGASLAGNLNGGSRTITNLTDVRSHGISATNGYHQAHSDYGFKFTYGTASGGGLYYDSASSAAVGSQIWPYTGTVFMRDATGTNGIGIATNGNVIPWQTGKSLGEVGYPWAAWLSNATLSGTVTGTNAVNITNIANFQATNGAQFGSISVISNGVNTAGVSNNGGIWGLSLNLTNASTRISGGPSSGNAAIDFYSGAGTWWARFGTAQGGVSIPSTYSFQIAASASAAGGDVNLNRLSANQFSVGSSVGATLPAAADGSLRAANFTLTNVLTFHGTNKTIGPIVTNIAGAGGLWNSNGTLYWRSVPASGTTNDYKVAGP